MIKGAFIAASLVVSGSMMFLSSCTETKTNKPAPTLTLSAASASNTAGSAVTTTVSVNAPEGGKTLSILVNGVANSALPDVALAGATTKDVPVSFTIPASAVVGATYVISFQASDNKSQQSLVAAFTATVSAVPSKPIVDVTGTLTGAISWTADKIYRLNGFVRIGQDTKVGGATTPTIGATGQLTIAAGTVILGKTGIPGGALIIQRGSTITANGTASQPIVFTSEKAPGSRVGGDWSGVVLCGQSANNIKGSTGTDGIAELEGSYAAFHGGGASPILNDNSGSLKYVRIEFAGYPINPNQELNGLTFASVGSGTTIQYVQVTYANDDSFEWFGGTVNCTNIISYKGIDDDFDTDNGFSGYVQYGLGIRDTLIADQSGSNGFEADNDGNGSGNMPFTSAVFTNMTMIGAKQTSSTTINVLHNLGAHLRRNLKQKIFNTIWTGYPSGIFIDGTAGAPSGTADAVINAQNGDVVLKNNILAGVDGWGGNGYGSTTTTGTSTGGIPDENSISGLPFGSNANHPNNPRGRVFAAGNIPSGSAPFNNGVLTENERPISNINSLTWFLQNNTAVAKWTDATIGLNPNIFEPRNGTPTLIPTGSLLTAGASFSDPVFANAPSAIKKTITFRGAFGATDWTTGGWVNWNPQLTDYSK